MKRLLVLIGLLAGCASSQPAIDYSSLTPEQVMMYQQLELQRQANRQQFYANLAAGNAALAAGTRYPTMQVPSVAPIGRQSNQIRCIRAGIYTNCRY